MKTYKPFVLVLGFLAQVQSSRITLDEEAQNLCKKYKMMCKTGKICAVQHFDWPKNITIPVCIPLSFVPVRSLICQLPPESGHCSARYIRWYYNIHSQECSHFQYGGCNGNQNNFMSKVDCEQSCLQTPSIALYEGGQSALVQMKPSVMTAPVYEPPNMNKYEALNSVMLSGSENNYDRYQLMRHKTNRIRNDEANTRTRRRLDKERAKERRRRERRKEKKRLRRLRLEKKQKKGKRSKKGNKRGRKKKKNGESEVVNETLPDETGDEKQTEVVVEETKKIISNEIESAEDQERKEKRKERKRKKRREKQRKKRRLKQDGLKNTKSDKRKRYAELVKKPESVMSYKMFSILDQ